MAVPQFLAGAFRYLLHSGVVDVQTIIDDVYTELIANGWTCTAGGSGSSPTTMLSPLRSDYMRFSITLTRYNATSLDWAMNDHAGNLVSSATTYRQVITAAGAGTRVHIFTGPTYCYVVNIGGTNWNIRNCCLDNEPFADLVTPRPQYMSNYGPYEFGNDYQAWNTDTYSYGAAYGVPRIPIGSFDSRPRSVAGSYLSYPLDIVVPTAPPMFIGRMPQALYTDQLLSPEAEITFPIDSGVTGVFMIASVDSSQGAIAYRKA